MILDPGTRLGPYEIRELAGSGGMGEVYRGLDTRLNRTVAIKILPSRLATSAIRRARFEREARAVSRLSHPHICAIYDVGEEDGVAFLVMEYVDGPSLDQRLRAGRLPLGEALDFSIQIASALCAAHERDIVHRDLKPGNVMLAENGVKLLDFGIAKLLDEEAAPAPDGATSTLALTAEHRIVGTLNYMAPEQLEGGEIDQRADLFAFGALLYEMLTGSKAFGGSSPATVSAAVLTGEPPPVSTVLAQDAAVPRALDHIIRRALAKKPDERWQTARDVMLELRSIRDDAPRAVFPAATPGHRPRRLVLAAAGLVVAAAAAVAAALVWNGDTADSRSAKPSPIVLTIQPPEGTEFDPGFGSLAVSPDGLKIAFIASTGASRSLWVRYLNSATPRRLLATEGAGAPFWSPDGRFVGFYDEAGHLSRVDINGGKPEVITEAVGTFPAACWTPDNWIVFNRNSELWRVPAFGGGPAARFTAPDEKRNERSFWFPSPLPDGRVLFTVRAPQLNTGSRIHAASGEMVDLPTVLSNAAFAAGHLIFRQGPALVAQAFDSRSARFTGQPVTIAYDVRYNPNSGRTAFSASADVIAYRADAPRRLTWMDRGGRRLGSIGDEGRDWNPVLAPDGSNRVVFDRFDPATGGFQVWTMDDQGRPTAFTHGVKERFGTWSPDGQWIAYYAPTAKGVDIRRRRVATPDRDELITQVEGQASAVPLDWTRDGRLIFERGRDLWMVPIDPPGAPVPLTRTAAIERVARASPDGKWLAYSSVEPDRRTIWVQSFPGAAQERIQVGNGLDPSWRQDGKELYYMALDGTLMAAAVTAGSPLRLGPAVPLFRIELGAGPLHFYAAASDGQRFLVSEVTAADPPITVVVHWPALLRQ